MRRCVRVLVGLVAVVGAPLVVVAATVVPAAAAAFAVDNAGDPAVGNPANCPAVPAGTCTLRDAVAAANANPGPDLISVTVGPISLTNGSLSHPSTDLLALQGNGHTIMQTTAADVLVSNGPVTLDAVTTTGGNSGFVAAGTVTVSNSSIGTSNGDGVVTTGAGTDITVTQSTISVANGSGVIATRNATVTGASTITSSTGVGVIASAGSASVDASSVSGHGAGVVAQLNATVTGSTVTSDAAAAVVASTGNASVSAATVSGHGGGVIAGTDVTVTASTVTSDGNWGVIASNGVATVADSSVTGFTGGVFAATNTTLLRSEAIGGPGGNGVIANNGTATVTASTVHGSGQNGVAGGTGAVITNSTVTGNGGCGVSFPNGSVTLVYATVVENATSSCGANIAAASLTSFGSVVALTGAGANCAVTTKTSHGFNHSDDTTCGFSDPTDTQSGNPLLGALGANGGPTPTRLPQPGSPLIDAITATSCQADGATGITTDQRGVARPQGVGCDIGAVEVVPPTPPAPPSPPLLIQPTFTG
jgi:hypothetical protein